MYKLWIPNDVYALCKTVYPALGLLNATNFITARNLCKENSSDDKGKTSKPTHTSGQISIKPTNRKTRHVPVTKLHSPQKPRSFRIIHPESQGLIYVILGKKTNGKEINLFVEKVPSAELEELLRQHPAVSDTGVIGVPDTRNGEVPVAYVVPSIQKWTMAEELKQYVADSVSLYKYLADVAFVESIPKTASGKILRKELKKCI